MFDGLLGCRVKVKIRFKLRLIMVAMVEVWVRSVLTIIEEQKLFMCVA